MKILVTSTFITPFISEDLILLRKHYDVEHLMTSGPIAPFSIARAVRRSDVVMTWFASTYAAAAVASAALFGKKSMIVVGGGDVAGAADIGYGIWLSPWKSRLTRYALRHADKVLAVDPFLGRQAALRGEYDGKNIQVLPTGYDASAWTPGVVKERQVLTVAVCNSRERLKVKGVALLFETARRIPDVPFVLAGIGARLLGEVRRQAPGNVEVRGEVTRDELLVLYRRARVYCQPSVLEGLPNAVCEAMLCGCIPVGTDVGGMGSAIGDAGMLVPSGDATRLADGIVMGLEASAAASARARESIATRFTLQRREDGLLKTIRELLGMKAPLRNIVAILVGDAGSRGIGFLVTMYLARTLAPSSFGVINLGLAVLGYLTLLNIPGVQMLEVRNAAATTGGLQERAGAIISFRLIAAPLLIAMTWGGLAVIGVPAETRDVILLYAFSLVPLALSLDWLFQGKEDFRRVTASRLLNAMVVAVAAVALVRSNLDVRMTAVAFLVGSVAATTYLGVKYRTTYGKPSMRWDLSAWGGILRDNAPVGTAMFLSQSVTNLPPLAIGVLLTNADVGMYSAAMKMAFMMLIVDRTFSVLFLPLATRYAVTRSSEFPQLLLVGTKVIAAVLVPLIIVACIVAEPAVRLIFGPGYEQAVPLFRILSMFVLITVFNSVFIATLLAFGRTKEYSIIVGIGGVFIIVSVCVLTLLAGSVGAAVGVVLGEVAILVMLARAASRLSRIPSPVEILKPAAAGLVMVASAFVSSGLDVAISLAVSVGAFVLVLVLTGGVPMAEFRYLKERLV